MGPRFGDRVPARGGAKRGGGFRINEEIRIRQVRLVDADGQMQGVVATEQAQEMARDSGLDLVEVSPNADPPVCKILDYGKFKYEQKKRDHEARRRQRGTELKEVRFRPKTDTHDKQIKIERARSFLEDGHRVQLTMMFRGREMQHKQLGVGILRVIAKGLEDVAKTELGVRSEGRRMHMSLVPKPNVKPAGQKKTKEAGKEAAKAPSEEAAKALGEEAGKETAKAPGEEAGG